MKKILLIGNFGAKNLGDELILDAALEEYGVENCIVMTADKTFSKEFVQREFEAISPFPTGIRSFFRFCISRQYRKHILNQRPQVGKIVFVGGGLFAIKTRAFFIWWLTSVWIKILFKKVPVEWQYQGIDMPNNFVEKFFLKSALKGVGQVSTRDNQSCEAYHSLYKPRSCEVQKDRVERGLDLGLFGVPNKSKKKILILNAIKKISHKEFSKINNFAKLKDLKIIFVHFSLDDDKKRLTNVKGKHLFPQTKMALLDIFSTADSVIGERFHALVLGDYFCKGKTYLFREPYSQKVRSFCKLKGIKKI